MGVVPENNWRNENAQPVGGQTKKDTCRNQAFALKTSVDECKGDVTTTINCESREGAPAFPEIQRKAAQTSGG
jgi:hypothetical protein